MKSNSADFLKYKGVLDTVVESMPHSYTVTLGVWIKCGGFSEEGFNCGIAHFTEHMLFKGTQNRSAKDISREMDIIGAGLNAYTSEEYTCFYVKIIKQDMEKAFSLLFDILQNPLFNENDIEQEKRVVIEEINTSEDDPEDIVQDTMLKKLYGSHPAGNPILGKREDVERITRDELISFYNKFYTHSNMIVSVAGDTDIGEVVKLLDSNITNVRTGAPLVVLPEVKRISNEFIHIKRNTSQMQLSFGYLSYNRNDSRIYSLLLLANIVGNSGSSRLFSVLRDEYGLVYNVEATVHEYPFSGVFAVSTGFSAENYTKIIELCRNELCDIMNNGVSNEELDRAKKFFEISYIFDKEGTYSAMERNAKKIFLSREKFDEDYVLQRIKDTTPEEIRQCAADTFSTGEVQAVCGKINKNALIHICGI
ncbi:MAG: insulinase family protein [Clostridiales bacterium]|nr:insulinase family protein [Clostridiales bacterium]